MDSSFAPETFRGRDSTSRWDSSLVAHVHSWFHSFSFYQESLPSAEDSSEISSKEVRPVM